MLAVLVASERRNMQQLRATPTTVREEVLRTYAGAQHEDRKLCSGALGLAGETGEGADLVKKHLFQSHVLDRARLLDELADVLWYSMLICHTLDFSLKT
jgi:NTP pyrophosphatase (non-canonical NTP hydrolase)